MILIALANASLNSRCSCAKHNLKVLSVSQSAMLICSYPTKVVKKQFLFKTISFNEFQWFNFIIFGLIDVLILSVLIHCELFWYWKMLKTGILPKEKWKRIIHCSMKTKIMEITITSETVSQNTVSREMEEPVTEKVPEISIKGPEST